MVILLESVAGVTYDSSPKLWDHILSLLNLKLAFQPAIAEILREEKWRDAENPKAYVAKAAYQLGLRMRLPDFSDRQFRRVASGDISGATATDIDSVAGFNLEEWGGGGVYEPTASGGLRYVNFDDADFGRELPRWLQRGDENDGIDWETVAAYAVRKPSRACFLSRVLIARYSIGLSRQQAQSRASSPEEVSKIEAAWKWIDRNVADLISPLLQRTTPPRPLTSADIASFPLLAQHTSLRVDVRTRWEGNELLLERTGLGPDGNEVCVLDSILAECETAAQEELRLAAGDWADPDIFHVWVIEPTQQRLTRAFEGPGQFPKPWDVLSRTAQKTRKLL